MPNPEDNSSTLFGHPTGLFTLFFAEMWERFSYYGMRALLIFYMAKGFLKFEDKDAIAVYGSYTALVYMTPFFGGMLADRLLGKRRAVVLGGLLMAAGHLMMMVEQSTAFYVALALLICGNGFFKPNISTIVGSLYPEKSTKRDGGFTIFYMGINLGAAMSPLLCGYIGETYGWHLGFGLATIGMLTGLAVFVMPTLVTQMLILVGAAAAAISMLFFRPDNIYSIGTNAFVAVSLVAAAIVAAIALNRGGLPRQAGAPPDPELLRKPIAGFLPAEWAVYLGTLLMIPVFAMLVSGFAPFTDNQRSMTLISNESIKPLNTTKVLHEKLAQLATRVKNKSTTGVDELSAQLQVLQDEKDLLPEHVTALTSVVGLVKSSQWDAAESKRRAVSEQFPQEGLKIIAAVVLQEISRPAGLILFLCGLIAMIYLGINTIRLDLIPRQRMYVALILTFFSLLFWSFFEQAGSSVNNFTDRNVDRVFETRQITSSEIGTTIKIQPTQEQLGYHNGEQLFTLNVLDTLREEKSKEASTDSTKDATVFEIDWAVAEDNIGMGIAGRVNEVPASTFQAANPVYIIVFGLVFTALWTILGGMGLEPSTPVKFALGLAQLGLGFGAFWYGATVADSRGMVSLTWLLIGYLLQTTGELCLSPVGLSMVTKLSPKFLVSTMMGTWFLATAFSQFLAAIIAQFTGVSHGGDGEKTIPVPLETVMVYGDVFKFIAISALISGLICLILSPLLRRWMHEDKLDPEAAGTSSGH